MERLYLFEKERLEKVSAEAILRGINLDGRNCHLSGKGIDDMTPQEKFEEGKKGIGGSSVADIMGEGFDKDGPVGVFNKKIANAPTPVDTVTQRIFDQGHFSETMIFEMMNNVVPKGWKVVLDKNRYTDNERNYMFADFDGILVSPDGEEFPLEIKAYNDFPGKEKVTSGIYGEGGVLPHDFYKWQVRYYMHELNTRAGVVAVLPVGKYSESDLKLITFYRNFDKEQEMLEAIDDFWLNHVKKGIRPEYKKLSDDGLKNMKALGVFSPNYEEGKIIEFENDSNINDLLKECAEIQQKIQEFKLEKKHVENEIDNHEKRKNAIFSGLLQYMSDAQSAFKVIDGTNYTINRKYIPESRSVDTNTLKKKFPDIYNEILNLTYKVKEEKEEYELVTKNN